MNGIFDEGTSLFEIGAITTITGLVLVFSMLLFLVFVLWVFGRVASAATKASEKKALKAKEELAKQFAEDPSDQPAAVVQEPVTAIDGISNEIVAVISAAVTEMYAGTGKKPVIKSVKKAGSRRSAWASAGIADNTRSF